MTVSIGIGWIIDFDPAMTEMARNFALFAELNQHALDDSRIYIVNQDVMIWLEQPGELFDAAIVDFPDSNNYGLANYIRRGLWLVESAAVAIQCTSPLQAPRSYWCIVRAMDAAGFRVRP